MGRDKRHMEIGGISLVENAYRRLSEIFSQVLISVKDDEKLVAGACHISDAYGDAGPLGAVISAMEAAENEIVFVMACDIPDPPEGLIREMLADSDSNDVVVPIDHRGRYETLFAIYRRGILPVLRSLLENGEKRIRMAYPRVKTLEMKIPAGMTLSNLNTPLDVNDFLTGST